MIPIIQFHRMPSGCAARAALTLLAVLALGGAGATWAGPTASTTATAVCLSSGDGYLRARLAGAIDADIEWPNSGTHCEGEVRGSGGVRLSFSRAAGTKPNLLFVFGMSAVREGQPLRARGANLTLIVQGGAQIDGTQGESRCTVDALNQRRLEAAHTYRVEARGFCTQPAHAIRGRGEVLVSRFDFAGVVRYEDGESGH
jgi:hypothetical protein